MSPTALNPQKGSTRCSRADARASRHASSAASGACLSRRRPGQVLAATGRPAYPDRQPDDHREGLRPRSEDRRARPDASGDRRRPCRSRRQKRAAASSSRRCTCAMLSAAALHRAQLRQPAVERQGAAPLVLEFAALSAIRRWFAFIETEVRFPSTMVDRITPPLPSRRFADAARLTGARDLAAVETEPFSQWIIEDDFVGRPPDWEAGGALLRRRCRALREDEAPHAERRAFDARLFRLHRRPSLCARCVWRDPRSWRCWSRAT